MNMQKMSWTEQHDGLLGMGGKGDDTFKFDIPKGYQFAGFDAKVLAGKYGEGLRVSEKPGRGTTGKDKQAKVHWWFDGGSRSFIKYRATATFIDGAIEKEQRALLIAERQSRNLRAIGPRSTPVSPARRWPGARRRPLGSSAEPTCRHR